MPGAEESGGADPSFSAWLPALQRGTGLKEVMSLHSVISGAGASRQCQP